MKPIYNYLIIFSCLLLMGFGCSPKTGNTIATDYQDLPAHEELSKYIGKKVKFTAKLAKMEMQHMLRPSINKPSSYIVVEPDKKYKSIYQMLAYTNEADMLNKKYREKTFVVYGTLDMISGAGKGGGEHKEYYIELDKIE